MENSELHIEYCLINKGFKRLVSINKDGIKQIVAVSPDFNTALFFAKTILDIKNNNFPR